MLKIIHVRTAGGAAILRLEGRIAGLWVDELRRAHDERREAAAAPLTLDLANVTFIDGAGLAFLEEVYADVILINCSLFAAEQLKGITERHQRGRR